MLFVFCFLLLAFFFRFFTFSLFFFFFFPFFFFCLRQRLSHDTLIRFSIQVSAIHCFAPLRKRLRSITSSDPGIHDHKKQFCFFFCLRQRLSHDTRIRFSIQVSAIHCFAPLRKRLRGVTTSDPGTRFQERKEH